ncbi:MAG: terpene cyclase/mutase family protein, partial [Planctomycetes bacterium]|nr:terpene cyclase/mutase family protein [Planctomycetota bacterium]
STDNSNPGVTGTTGDAIGGTGGGNGQMFASFPGRSGATKSRLLREGGGNEESERAVAMGLAWLARMQKQDGGWEYEVGSKDERIAATGMALLPFLAAGETHLKGKKYTKTVNSGLQFLLRNCPLSGATAGRMSGNMYAHAIGALALCEAYGMTKDKGLLLAGAQAAINYIVKAQAGNGSWGYGAGAAGDTSIVGWQIQALKAAQLGKDVVVPAATIKKAIDFLNLAGGGSRKAMYGYADNTGAAPGTSLTAVGLLSRYYIDGWGPDNAGMAEGVTGIMKRAPVKSTASPDMYFYYYATQVVHFYEGDEWKTWNEGPKGADGTRKGGMRDWLISLQDKKDGPNQGSFSPGPGSIGGSCGRLGTTAMSILTLEVYYRHLPLYKRANAGDGALKIVDGAK